MTTSSIAICSKNGKLLVSRQFHRMTRLELEEQKLLNEINKVDEVVVKIKYDYQKLKQE